MKAVRTDEGEIHQTVVWSAVMVCTLSFLLGGPMADAASKTSTITTSKRATTTKATRSTTKPTVKKGVASWIDALDPCAVLRPWVDGLKLGRVSYNPVVRKTEHLANMCFARIEGVDASIGLSFAYFISKWTPCFGEETEELSGLGLHACYSNGPISRAVTAAFEPERRSPRGYVEVVAYFRSEEIPQAQFPERQQLIELVKSAERTLCDLAGKACRK
jgi:hypothetical protein